MIKKPGIHVPFAVLCVAVASLALPLSQAADGKAVFLDNKCNTCHAVPAAGIEAKTQSEKVKGPDLVGLMGHSSDEITKFLRKQGEIDGKSHKKEYKGTDEDLTVILDWLATQKGE